jgi:hypothetical protein
MRTVPIINAFLTILAIAGGGCRRADPAGQEAGIEGRLSTDACDTVPCPPPGAPPPPLCARDVRCDEGECTDSCGAETAPVAQAPACRDPRAGASTLSLELAFDREERSKDSNGTNERFDLRGATLSRSEVHTGVLTGMPGDRRTCELDAASIDRIGQTLVDLELLRDLDEGEADAQPRGPITRFSARLRITRGQVTHEVRVGGEAEVMERPAYQALEQMKRTLLEELDSAGQRGCCAHPTPATTQP